MKFKAEIRCVFKVRRKAELKTSVAPFVPAKIKLYRKLPYTSKIIAQITLKSTCLSSTNQCLWISVPRQNLPFLSYMPPVVENERLLELPRVWEGNQHTKPDTYILHHISWMFYHHIPLNTLGITHLGNQTGLDPVTAWTGDCWWIQVPQPGWSWCLM